MANTRSALRTSKKSDPKPRVDPPVASTSAPISRKPNNPPAPPKESTSAVGRRKRKASTQTVEDKVRFHSYLILAQFDSFHVLAHG